MKNIKLFSAVAFALFMTLFNAAHAAVPAEITAAATALQDDGLLVIGLIGGAMVTLASLAILFKWAKASIFG